MLAHNRAARVLRQLGVNRNEIGPDRAWRCQMASGGVSTGPDPPVRAQIVQQSEDTRVTRLSSPEATVIRKERWGPYAERRLLHELAMLERLRGVAGSAQLAEGPTEPGSRVP